MPASLRLAYSATEASVATLSDARQRVLDEEVQPPTDHKMLIEELYPATDAISAQLKSAMAFLGTACQTISEALRELSDGHLIAADDRMQQVQAHLYVAFCQREISEGYGGVINACICAFENSRGQPLNTEQATAILRALTKLRNAPFLTYDEALLLIEGLEQGGLNTDPAGFDALADLLTSESVR
jgi:hypothetical protein